jgi:putative methionine-R-sulfoxide reductase with GAF domain
MGWDTALRGIHDVQARNQGRAEQAAQIAELIRREGNYRWVGLYAVTEQEITVIGWSGPGAPAHPRFPVTQGLSGAAVATGRAVVVNDVTTDPRYLTAFASTLSEAIVPVVDPDMGTVGRHAGCGERRAGCLPRRRDQALEWCAAALTGLIAESRP